MLNLTQLGSFVAVAEELNFRKAAERLHLTQPALSRQIKLLEEAFDVELFTRSRRAVQLTGAGSLLLGEARVLLAAAERVQRLLGGRAEGTKAITIGVSTDLTERIRHVGLEFQKSHPKTHLMYREMSSTAQNLALHNREIDIGFLRAPVNPAYVSSAALFKEPLVVVLPRVHVLASSQRLTLSQLAGEPLFLRPRKSGSGLHDKVLAMYGNAGIKPKVVHTTLSPQFVANTHVASGEGIYILPEKVILENENVATVRLNEPGADREVHIAWRKGDRSPHILQFLDTAFELFRKARGTRARVTSRRPEVEPGVLPGAVRK